VIGVEDWAEIRRLRRAEGVSVSEIARRLGISRNTVRSALASDRPPKYERAPRPTLADGVEARVRAVLAEFPRMPATVIAQRIGWAHSLTTLKDRVRAIRPQYVGIDPVDRVVYQPGEIAQCDLWFPAPPIPVAAGQQGAGQERVLPVLVMTLAFSRFLTATMIPSRQAGDILSGMWTLISQVGRVTKTLVWDRESAIGGTGRVSAPAAAFAGTLATRIRLVPPRDPEFKGLVERNNGYLETSFLPGRAFDSPADFNAQLGEWLPVANARTVRAIHGRPVDLLDTDYAAMVELPPVAPQVGLTARVRLGRDYYVRVDGCDYSVDPRVIGRFVEVTASATQVEVRCAGRVVAAHPRCWGRHGVITDPDHQATAAQMRRALSAERHAEHRDHRRPELGEHELSSTASTTGAVRRHADGHVVALRPLPDYDALFGVNFGDGDFTTDIDTDLAPDFTPDSAAISEAVTSEEASS
jgi:transposase